MSLTYEILIIKSGGKPQMGWRQYILKGNPKPYFRAYALIRSVSIGFHDDGVVCRDSG